ncbi:uncharacterized protein OCT59_030145 [Rhizophagus irregularis]|uniref:uncharacterized protein n=1 Tax=Rhizophagus irregularis TaxID=588596 RepID=UPI00332CE427|nr:hypothetical protein OCT59_030145 [Rhizophagus irregularis]
MVNCNDEEFRRLQFPIMKNFKVFKNFKDPGLLDYIFETQLQLEIFFSFVGLRCLLESNQLEQYSKPLTTCKCALKR